MTKVRDTIDANKRETIPSEILNQFHAMQLYDTHELIVSQDPISAAICVCSRGALKWEGTVGGTILAENTRNGKIQGVHGEYESKCSQNYLNFTAPLLISQKDPPFPQPSSFTRDNE